MSLLAVILVLREHKALQKTAGLHLFMAALAVIEAWFLIHTVFTLHYGHVFYRSEQEADVAGTGGGLIFPGWHPPDYQDFAYFSFVVGMTCQVSDVNVTSRSMRRLALLHGLLAFAFNTVILALSINIISGLFVNLRRRAVQACSIHDGGSARVLELDRLEILREDKANGLSAESPITEKVVLEEQIPKSISTCCSFIADIGHSARGGIE